MGTSITHIPERLDRAIRQPWQMRAMAILDALILNLLILAGARVINGEYPVAKVGDDEQTIGFAQVIIVTVLAGLGPACVVLGVLVLGGAPWLGRWLPAYDPRAGAVQRSGR